MFMIPHFLILHNFTAQSIISISFISIEWKGRIPEVIPIMSIHLQPDVIDGESWTDLNPPELRTLPGYNSNNQH